MHPDCTGQGTGSHSIRSQPEGVHWSSAEVNALTGIFKDAVSRRKANTGRAKNRIKVHKSKWSSNLSARNQQAMPINNFSEVSGKV